MKSEILEKGNKLTKELATLKEYLGTFEKYPLFYSCNFADVNKNHSMDILQVWSTPEFLSKVAIEEFDYALKRIITATQKRIIELETELENL
jgi:hypothetical protein